MYEWQRQLIADNARKAKRSTCRTCGQLTVTGLNDDQCALSVAADPWIIDPRYAATLTRPVYGFIGGRLYRRIPPFLDPDPPYPLLAAHDCATPIPEHARRHVRPVVTFPLPDTPQF